jgi:hypothetical protein
MPAFQRNQLDPAAIAPHWLLGIAKVIHWLLGMLVAGAVQVPQQSALLDCMVGDVAGTGE